MSNWLAYDNGQSISRVGAEGGKILRDEEHKLGARVTLKLSENYISVSCSVYGWMEHTRFFGSPIDGHREYQLMKPLLANMVENILSTNDSDLKMWEAIADFVRRFP